MLALSYKFRLVLSQALRPLCHIQPPVGTLARKHAAAATTAYACSCGCQRVFNTRYCRLRQESLHLLQFTRLKQEEFKYLKKQSLSPFNASSLDNHPWDKIENI